MEDEKSKKVIVITSIATTNHEDTRRKRDVITNKGSERRVTLIPIKGTILLNVTSVPIESIAVVVGVAARNVSIHVFFRPPSWGYQWKLKWRLFVGDVCVCGWSESETRWVVTKTADFDKKNMEQDFVRYCWRPLCVGFGLDLAARRVVVDGWTFLIFKEVMNWGQYIHWRK